MKKTTRSQYLMRANLNVRPLVDIAQLYAPCSAAPRGRTSGTCGGATPADFPKKRKTKKNKHGGASVRAGKNADIMPVIIIIIGDRPPDRSARPHPIFIQMCLRVFFLQFFFPDIFSEFPLVKRVSDSLRYSLT